MTVCCGDRGGNDLVLPEIAEGLLDSVRFRNENEVWWCSAFVVMPDHVHGLFRFPEPNGMKKIMRNWKSWTARHLGASWQRDWFDHRLRRDESWREKAEYLWQNPVRAGLVEDASEWPWHFSADR